MIIVSSEDFGKVKERGLKDTDSGHNLIPRPQKNSSRRAPLLKWTRIKMERFVPISSFFSPLLSFCPRWPLKNLLQQFLLVNSSARCSPSRSLTSLLRMNKLFWEDTSQKWNVSCTAKTFSLGLNESWSSLVPHFGQTWLFVFLGQPRVPCFPSPCFQTYPLAMRRTRGKNEKNRHIQGKI